MCVDGATGTGTEEDDNGTSDGTVTDIFQVGNIEEEASNESKDDLVDAEDMDISVQEEEKGWDMAVLVQEEEEDQEELVTALQYSGQKHKKSKLHDELH